MLMLMLKAINALWTAPKQIGLLANIISENYFILPNSFVQSFWGWLHPNPYAISVLSNMRMLFHYYLIYEAI